MKLGDWRRQAGITLDELGRRIGRRINPEGRPVSAGTVQRWELPPDHANHRKPTDRFMRALVVETERKVTPNDWYDVAEATPADAAAA